MVDKKEHRSYMDVEIDQNKQTLAKSIEKEMRLKSLRDDLTRYGIGDGFSHKRTCREERSIEEPQGPQWG